MPRSAMDFIRSIITERKIGNLPLFQSVISSTLQNLPLVTFAAKLLGLFKDDMMGIREKEGHIALGVYSTVIPGEISR